MTRRWRWAWRTSRLEWRFRLCGRESCESRGLKPAFSATFNVRAEARTYLRSKSNSQKQKQRKRRTLQMSGAEARTYLRSKSNGKRRTLRLLVGLFGFFGEGFGVAVGFGGVFLGLFGEFVGG